MASMKSEREEINTKSRMFKGKKLYYSWNFKIVL